MKLYNNNNSKEDNNLTEDEIIRNTENDFNELEKMILDNNGMYMISQEILTLCLDVIKNFEAQKKINDEIDELCKIFNKTIVEEGKKQIIMKLLVGYIILFNVLKQKKLRNIRMF